MKQSGWAATAVLVLAFGSNARADDPKFVYGNHADVKDVKDVEWKASAEAGLVATTGNSETTNVTGAIHISRKTPLNLFAFDASGAYAKQGLRTFVDKNGNGVIDNDTEIPTVETVSAETLLGKLRYDRFLTEANSVFIAALASRDIPAGKEYAIGGQAGYARQLFANKVNDKTISELDGEFGFDFTREKPTVSDGISIASLRAFLGYKATLTEGADLQASGEILSNMNHETLATGKDGSAFMDTRFNGHVAITAKLSKNLAAQFSYDVHYDNRPDPLPLGPLKAPIAAGFVPEAESLDTIMKASFIYSFF